MHLIPSTWALAALMPASAAVPQTVLPDCNSMAESGVAAMMARLERLETALEAR